MARPAKISIVNVFAWFSNIIDTEDLTLTDTAVLTHIIKNLNRNFWKPLKMSMNKLAHNSGSDIRTIRASLKRLADKNIIFKRDGENLAKIDNPDEFFIGKQKAKLLKIQDKFESGIYFSIILRRNGEIHIGIETEKHYIENLKPDESTDGERHDDNTAQTSQNATEKPERPANIKTLAEFI